MRSALSPAPLNRWLEPVLALAVMGSLVWAMLFLLREGYLPYPFFYEPSDSWMDWFNTAYWSRNIGSYDSWNSVYPPLSFVIVRLFSTGSCYEGAEGLPSRECDMFGAVSLHAFYILNVILIARMFMKIDRNTALPRSIALAAGLPMLFGLERGNLIIITFTCVLLAYGPLLKSARWRWLAAGFAINLKIYLIAALFPQLLRRRWRWFEGAIAATIIVYLVTFMILGVGTPRDIYRNLGNITEVYQSASFLDGWYASSYKPFLSLLQGSEVPVTSIIGSHYVDLLSLILPALQLSVQVSIVFAVIAAWLRPEVVPMFRITGLGIALAIITAESGGYVVSLVLLFVFMERWRSFGTKWAIIMAYIISLPTDIPIDRYGSAVQYGALTGRTIVYEFVLTLGPFIRPLMLMTIPFALSWVTILTVWKDIEQQGWKTRWRFRHDVPIMVGDGVATPPATAS